MVKYRVVILEKVTVRDFNSLEEATVFAKGAGKVYLWEFTDSVTGWFPKLISLEAV